MARKTKDAPGRVTPKGTQPGARPTAKVGSRVTAPAPTGRYTAPVRSDYESSGWYVMPLMVTMFALGGLIIILNYLGVEPSSPSNWYLLGGLGLIVVGFIVATRWR